LFNAALIRFLGRKLAEERDPQKIEELAAALRSVISSDVQDARLRLQFILRQHPQLGRDLVDTRHTEDVQKP
jgi:2-oxo-4-hydroxy-4-carboxy--5-ureidoimidazoline (OHCU) decarboxylase